MIGNKQIILVDTLQEAWSLLWPQLDDKTEYVCQVWSSKIEEIIHEVACEAESEAFEIDGIYSLEDIEITSIQANSIIGDMVPLEITEDSALIHATVPVIICTVVCAFRFHALLKAGICTAVSGITLYCANHVATVLFGPSSSSSYQVDFHNWEQCLNGNVQLIMFLSFLFVSAVFIAIGLFRVIRNNKR